MWISTLSCGQLVIINAARKVPHTYRCVLSRFLKKLAYLRCFQNPVINRKTSGTYKQLPTWANFISVSTAKRDIHRGRFSYTLELGWLWETRKSEKRNTHHELGEIKVVRSLVVSAHKGLDDGVKPVPTVFSRRGPPKECNWCLKLCITQIWKHVAFWRKSR